MPSTVKVRIKAARNLATLNPTAFPAAAPTATSAAAAAKVPASDAAAATPPPTTHVTVTLGGHSAVAEYDEDDDQGYQWQQQQQQPQHVRSGSKFQWQGRLGAASMDADEGAATATAAAARTSRCYSARTRTVRRSSDPTFNEEFRFEVADDTLLQDEPLLFHVWDVGGGGGGSSIGLVYVDLNPLLMRTANLDGGDDRDEAKKGGAAASGDQEAQGGGGGGRSERSGSLGATVDLPLGPGGGSSASVVGGAGGGAGGGPEPSGAAVVDGWFPLYDTLGGVRGELCLSVKLNFIGDKNPFRDSSAGVQLFPFSTLDGHSGYTVAHVFGFVEELVVADDPEFEWSDNFNQARTSHETRQTLMYLLDAKVRRRMCKKVLEMGGNAVLAFRQSFDMEGDRCVRYLFVHFGLRDLAIVFQHPLMFCLAAQ